MKKNRPTTSQISNKRAHFDYEIKHEYIAGVVLTGAETKSLRLNRASLQGSFVTMRNNEAWINNMQIMPTNTNRTHLPEDTQTRARKLLLKAKELAELAQAKEQGNALVPIKVLTRGRYVKIVIATGRGKKAYDKRSKIKERDTNRDIHRDLKK